MITGIIVYDLKNWHVNIFQVSPGTNTMMCAQRYAKLALFIPAMNLLIEQD